MTHVSRQSFLANLETVLALEAKNEVLEVREDLGEMGEHCREGHLLEFSVRRRGHLETRNITVLRGLGRAKPQI